jgi:hypothetical protein
MASPLELLTLTRSFGALHQRESALDRTIDWCRFRRVNNLSLSFVVRADAIGNGARTDATICERFTHFPRASARNSAKSILPSRFRSASAIIARITWAEASRPREMSRALSSCGVMTFRLRGFRAKITRRFMAVETKRIAAIGHFTVDSVRPREDEGRSTRRRKKSRKV